MFLNPKLNHVPKKSILSSFYPTFIPGRVFHWCLYFLDALFNSKNFVSCIYLHINFIIFPSIHLAKDTKREGIKHIICLLVLFVEANRSWVFFFRFFFATWAFLISIWIPGQHFQILCKSLWEAQESEAIVNLCCHQ